MDNVGKKFTLGMCYLVKFADDYVGTCSMHKRDEDLKGQLVIRGDDVFNPGILPVCKFIYNDLLQLFGLE